MSDKMLFLTSWPGGKLIPVDILGKSKHRAGGLYIRYPTGGTDTTDNDFLYEIPEGLYTEAELQEKLRQQREANLEIYCDRYFLNGIKAGWNLCAIGDVDTYQQIVNKRRTEIREAIAGNNAKIDD